MKNLIAAATATAAILPVCAAEENAAVEESTDCPLHAEVSVDLLSDYMWRGVILDHNPSYQPSVTLSYESENLGTFGFNYWTSLDFTHKRNTCGGGGNSRRNGSMIEQDFYLYYSNAVELDDMGEISYEVGHYWYDYPYNGKNHKAGSLGTDLYAGVFWDNGYVTPGAEVLWAYGNYHDHEPATAYLRLSLKKDFEGVLFEDLTITPKASLGIGDTAFVQNNAGNNDAHTEMTDQTLTLSASYAVTEHFSVGANVNYTWTPSHTLRQNRYMSCGDDNAHQLVWGGVNATLSF